MVVELERLEQLELVLVPIVVVQLRLELVAVVVGQKQVVLGHGQLELVQLKLEQQLIVVEQHD